MEYSASLDRALEAVPDIGSGGDRLQVPNAHAQPDGAFTRFVNLLEVANALAREPDHIHRYVQRSLATSGKLDDGVGRYNGNFTDSDFEGAIESYTEEYVHCSECGLPDTRLVQENRTMMLRCDACGAFRPVTKRNTSRQRMRQSETVREGESYTVEITDTGRKGDGVAHRGEYTIFVPGASEGEVVEVFIKDTSGKLAFAQMT